MTPTDFIPLLESALQARGEPFERAAVLTFVADCWPLIEDDPDAERWAREFAAAGWVPAEV